MYDESRKIYIYKMDFKKGELLELTSCDWEFIQADDGKTSKYICVWYDIGNTKSRYKKHRDYFEYKQGIVEVGFPDKDNYKVWFRQPQKERAKKLLLKTIKKERKEILNRLDDIDHMIDEIEQA